MPREENENRCRPCGRSEESGPKLAATLEQFARPCRGDTGWRKLETRNSCRWKSGCRGHRARARDWCRDGARWETDRKSGVPDAAPNKAGKRGTPQPQTRTCSVEFLTRVYEENVSFDGDDSIRRAGNDQALHGTLVNQMKTRGAIRASMLMNCRGLFAEHKQPGLERKEQDCGCEHNGGGRRDVEIETQKHARAAA